MNLREKILIFMHTEAYKPLAPEDLAEVLELKAKELTEFWRVLEELEGSAEIIKTRFGKYGVPERMNLMAGTLSASDKGYGFVLPNNPEERDVYIPVDSMMNAMHGDRVVARLHNRKAGAGKAREGEIIRIVRRANSQILGTFENSRHFGFVTPDESRIRQDIFIPKGEFNGAKNGSKVVVEITKWPEKKRSAEGRVVEVLGHKGDPGIEILSIIRRHNLSTTFPQEVEQASLKVRDTITEDELVGRRDLRALPVVTVDSEDAKDLDDAVYVERLKNGRFLLGVHIADVSYYVCENTALDNEARERGTSVYLVDRVLPMLPHRLSNGICSLNAGEDRLTLSAHMEVDHRGNVMNYEIFPSVIRVNTRLSYNAVRGILVDNDAALKEKYQPLLDHIADMERLCRILRDRRMRRGAIDFDFPELKVKLNERGQPVEIVKRVRSIAESIIEEFMLLANETVAEHMHSLGVPFVFRVHEEPETEKMVKLDNLLHNFGLNLGKTEEVSPKALQKILGRIAGQPEERIISTVMLRSLKQARYEAENLGHFGLAAPFYTHFTSPIRRYPDLVVHRILRETFTGGDVSAKRRQKLAALLPEIALHSSARERSAAEAERETVDLKKVEYMAQFIGDEFGGNINGVTAFGLFVELDNGVEGLVHVSSMDDDYYCYAEEQYALIGERSGKTYRLGDAVRVILVKVNPEERNIDFELSRDMLGPKAGGKKRTRKEAVAEPEKTKSRRKKPPGTRQKRKK
ncbi:MAG: rnr [Firmicutes bacterium]|nr:rnr [Bacillota bacterium]